MFMPKTLSNKNLFFPGPCSAKSGPGQHAVIKIQVRLGLGDGMTNGPIRASM